MKSLAQRSHEAPLWAQPRTDASSLAELPGQELHVWSHTSFHKSMPECCCALQPPSDSLLTELSLIICAGRRKMSLSDFFGQFTSTCNLESSASRGWANISCYSEHLEI